MALRPDPPDWIADGVRAARAELRLFFATAAAFLRAPDRFAVAWAEQRRHALNPFAFVATTVALLEPAKYLLSRYVLDASFGSAWFELLSAFGRYLLGAVFGLLFHPFMRLGGSRQPLRATLGIAMFTVGAPAPIANLLIWAVFGLSGIHFSLRTRLPGLYLSLMSLYLFPLIWYLRALVALHQVRWRTALLSVLSLAVAAVVLTTAVVLGARSLFHYHFHLPR